LEPACRSASGGADLAQCLRRRDSPRSAKRSGGGCPSSRRASSRPALRAARRARVLLRRLARCADVSSLAGAGSLRASAAPQSCHVRLPLRLTCSLASLETRRARAIRSLASQACAACLTPLAVARLNSYTPLQTNTGSAGPSSPVFLQEGPHRVWAALAGSSPRRNVAGLPVSWRAAGYYGALYSKRPQTGVVLNARSSSTSARAQGAAQHAAALAYLVASSVERE